LRQGDYGKEKERLGDEETTGLGEGEKTPKYEFKKRIEEMKK